MAELLTRYDPHVTGDIPTPEKLFVQRVLATDVVVAPPGFGGITGYVVMSGHRYVARVRILPDLTGATPDITLWTIDVRSTDGQRRMANLANSFTVEFDPRRPGIAPFVLIPYYAGVVMTSLLNDALYLEGVEV